MERAHPDLPLALMRFALGFYDQTYRKSDCREIIRELGVLERRRIAFADHGPAHVLNVVSLFPEVLNRATRAGLIPKREQARLSFMRQTGQINALLHDIWMKDLSKTGRDLHPLRAAQEVFTAEFAEPLVGAVEGKGKLGEQLSKIYGVPADALKAVAREIMSLCYTHSAESGVTVEMFRDPYHLQIHMQSLDLPEASFEWLTANPTLAADVVDMCRCVRATDTLRMRSAEYRTSFGARIFPVVCGNEAVAGIRIIDAEGRGYIVLCDDPVGMGEANVTHTGLNEEGDLVLAVSRSEFGSEKKNRAMGRATARALVEVYQDYVSSFDESALIGKLARLHLPKRTAPEFREEILKAVAVRRASKQGKPGPRLEVVEPLWVNEEDFRMGRKGTQLELERFHSARETKFSAQALKEIKSVVTQGGMDTSRMDFKNALTGSRELLIPAGGTLFVRGAEADYVYLPLEDGLTIGVAGSYPEMPPAAGVPLGFIYPLSGLPRSIDVVAGEKPVSVLAVPGDTFREHWLPAFYTLGDGPKSLERRLNK